MAFIVKGVSCSCCQVTNRVINLGYAGVKAYKTARSGALAIITSAGALATLGSSVNLLNDARVLAQDFDNSTANTYLALLRVLNPNAKCSYELPHPSKTEDILTANGRPLIIRTPVASRFLAINQQKMMNSLNKGNWLNRYVTARLAAPLSAIVVIVYTAVRMIIGLGAAVLSMIAFGSHQDLNAYAWNNLYAPGFMINQLQHGLLGIVRPSLV